MINLKSILQQYPNCLESRSAFKSILLNRYPEEKRTINILTTIYECGMTDKLKGKLIVRQDDIKKLADQLEVDYGTNPKYSEQALLLWADALGSPPIPSQDIYLLIDACGAMHVRMSYINAALQYLIERLKEVDSHWDCVFRLRILQFNSGASWQTNSLVDLSHYVYQDMYATGLCDLGAAYKLLNEQLCKANFGMNTCKSPVIALFSANGPTDNWCAHFKTLEQNEIFKYSRRIAFSLSQDADTSVLEKFTGHKNLVRNVQDPASLMSGMVLLSSIITPEGDECNHIYDELIADENTFDSSVQISTDTSEWPW